MGAKSVGKLLLLLSLLRLQSISLMQRSLDEGILSSDILAGLASRH